jgi:hypothetical protein
MCDFDIGIPWNDSEEPLDAAVRGEYGFPCKNGQARPNQTQAEMTPESMSG